jgi:hypothetical protein
LFEAMWVKLLELPEDLGLSLNFFGGSSNLFLPVVTLRLRGVLPLAGQSGNSEIKLVLRTN